MVDPTRQVVNRDGAPERRRAERGTVRLDASYEDIERQVFLVTHDISELGVYLLCSDPPAIGLPAQVTLELPSDPAILRLRGTVVRRSANDPRGFALRFDPESVSDPLRRLVRRFVESHRSDP